MCKLQGSTSSSVIVGGHYDFAEEGRGIVDDWSGAAMLASLYEALKTNARQHTYIFVAFAKEEQGLIGSSRYVKSLTREDKASVRAFINLECLGLSSTKVWASRATPELVNHLSALANGLGVPLDGVNVEQVGDDDSHPFLSAHLPVITIHSVTQDTWRILHSNRDQLNAIHFDDYYTTYKLLAFYLAYLDAKLGADADSGPHK
ncbi:MAG TPA: M28 family peptidase [Bryobacteraceae bacterium]|nr:M28 family peptidase [Bryobacteraceae bacterium]